MRLIFITLVLSILSFKSYSMTVENAYKYCKSYVSNNFQIKSLNDVLCSNTFIIIRDTGYNNCIDLRTIRKKRADKGADIEELSSLVSIMLNFANENTSLKNVVLNFLDWVEKNPDKIKDNVISHTYLYLSKKFPCN